MTRDQYQSTLSHLSVPNNKLTQDSVVVKWDAERERVAILTLEHGSDDQGRALAGERLSSQARPPGGLIWRNIKCNRVPTRAYRDQISGEMGL